jgi:hypothetical protein
MAFLFVFLLFQGLNTGNAHNRPEKATGEFYTLVATTLATPIE